MHIRHFVLFALSAVIGFAQGSPGTSAPEGFVRVEAASTRIEEGASATPMEVRTTAFWIAREELSQQEFERVMGRNPSSRKGPNLPVENITWNDALAYCNRRSDMEGLTRCYGSNQEWNRDCTGYRLPTDAEWLAALNNMTDVPQEVWDQSHLYRGGRTVADIQQAANVGTRPTNAGPLVGAGVRNALGNVWEWCWDRYHAPRLIDSIDDPQGPQDGRERVIRGGSLLTAPRQWNHAFRSSYQPDQASPFLGMRLARSIPGEKLNLPPRELKGIVAINAPNGPSKPDTTRIRKQWLDMLGEIPAPKQPMRVSVVATYNESTWNGRLLEFTGAPGVPWRALLMLPVGEIRKPLPTVIVPFYDVDTPAGKDLGGRRTMPPSPRSLGLLAVQHGMAALAFRWAGEEQGPGYLEAVAEISSMYPNVTGMGYWVWQSQRILDWLVDQPEVDRNRIGVVGHSLGGKMAIYSSAFDQRIRVIASSEPGIAFEFTNYQDPWYMGERLKLLPQGTDQHELLQLIAPRPFLLIAGEDSDGAKSVPVMEKAAGAYEAQGGKGKLVILNHATGHAMTPEAVSNVMVWLKQELEGIR
jgi:formylglycine-generating enzyme required for sulfatase activity/predicted esterase